MENRLKFWQKTAYGLGAFGSNYSWTFISAFVLIYCTDTVGVGAAVIGTLMMIAKVLDGFTDVMMGGIIDRTRSKMGKARFWLFWSIPPLVISQVLLFSVPAGFSELAKNIYIFILYTALGAFFYTANDISYSTLTSLATDNPRERVAMGSFRQFFGVFAAMLLYSTTPMLVERFGGGQGGWTGVSVLYAAVCMVLMMITVFGVREMKSSAGDAENTAQEKKTENVPFGKSMVLLFRNKYFLIMLGIIMLTYLSGGISGAIGIYYATYVLKNPALLGILSMASTIPMMIGIIITPKLTGKFGMVKTCLYGTIISIIGALIVVFSRNSVPVLVVGLIIRSVGSAPLQGALYGIIAEVAEYSFYRFKVRMEGTIYSCSSVGIKVGSGIGVALTGWLLAAGRYDGMAEVQTESAVTMIQYMYTLTPLIYAVLLVILFAIQKVEQVNKNLKAEGV
ncbi:MAG: glycoside-pentoside-hexuronide (GPH):cation symporter [Treponema sp.]|jgi:GPH family glycoside/pentoside/hexuronide:cation symporter|nr:glycoside-pentoside-hexuronide (GPH):cation symporter [Treponema sp.]